MIFLFCYSTEGPYGEISFERPYKVVVLDVATWASCLKISTKVHTVVKPVDIDSLPHTSNVRLSFRIRN